MPIFWTGQTDPAETDNHIWAGTALLRMASARGKFFRLWRGVLAAQPLPSWDDPMHQIRSSCRSSRTGASKRGFSSTGAQ